MNASLLGWMNRLSPGRFPETTKCFGNRHCTTVGSAEERRRNRSSGLTSENLIHDQLLERDPCPRPYYNVLCHVPNWGFEHERGRPEITIIYYTCLTTLSPKDLLSNQLTFRSGIFE